MLNPAPSPFKKNLPDIGAAPALSGFSVLAVEGAGAESFLQAQTMNDLRALAVGRWHWNGWLNPKGRLIALFALARIASDGYLLILPDFPADALLPLLQRFVFRSKVGLRVRADLICAAAFDLDPVADGMPDHVGGAEGSGFSLDLSGAHCRRQLRLLSVDSPAPPPADQTIDARWLEMDIRHGLPRLGAGLSESWTPQMLSLERLNAFSLKKGCYPGQEIVARTHYLGQSKRALACLQGSELAVGAAVTDPDGGSVGVIVVVSADRRMALAVANRDALSGELQVADQAVELLPLLPGLARPLVTELTQASGQMPETGA